MALITRVARLFRADLHAVLDRIEEPEALLRQAVREMEEVLGRDRARLDGLGRERTRLQAREVGFHGTLQALAEELEVCFQAGDEALARRVIRRRLETQRLAQALDERRRALEREHEALSRRVEENGVRLEAMRREAALVTRDGASEEGEVPDGAPPVGITAEDVEVAFLREKQRRAST